MQDTETKRVTVNLTPEVYELLRADAEREKRTMANHGGYIIEAYYEAQREQPKDQSR